MHPDSNAGGFCVTDKCARSWPNNFLFITRIEGRHHRRHFRGPSGDFSEFLRLSSPILALVDVASLKGLPLRISLRFERTPPRERSRGESEIALADADQLERRQENRAAEIPDKSGNQSAPRSTRTVVVQSPTVKTASIHPPA